VIVTDVSLVTVLAVTTPLLVTVTALELADQDGVTVLLLPLL